MMGYGIMGGGIFSLLIIGLLIYLIFSLFNRGGSYPERAHPDDDALEILKIRYAKGEMNEEEYKRKKKMTENSKKSHIKGASIRRWKWPLIISGIAILLLVAGYSTFAKMNSGTSTFFGNMMGTGVGGMMGEGYQNADTISSSDAKQKMEASLKKAIIDKENNSITFSGNDVQLAFLGGPEEADGKFVLGELVNPTIYVPKDARVDLILMNADEGMPHGIEITSAAPPYSQMSMMQGSVLEGAIISPIPAAANDNYPISETTFQINQSGEYYYICQYPGHAANGMYGKIIFK